VRVRRSLLTLSNGMSDLDQSDSPMSPTLPRTMLIRGRSRTIVYSVFSSAALHLSASAQVSSTRPAAKGGLLSSYHIGRDAQLTGNGASADAAQRWKWRGARIEVALCAGREDRGGDPRGSEEGRQSTGQHHRVFRRERDPAALTSQPRPRGAFFVGAARVYLRKSPELRKGPLVPGSRDPERCRSSRRRPSLHTCASSGASRLRAR
jgi:hypothetical protein